jgi:O-methyltransferase
MKTFFRQAIRSFGYNIVRSTEGEEGTYSDFTTEDHAMIARVKPFTMTSKERIFALRAAVRYVVENELTGDFVECGVWRGGSTMVMALTLRELGATERELHLFDTFEGMPPPQEVDRRFDGVSAQALLERNEKTADNTYWAIAALEDVQRNLATTGYPAARLHYVKGLVEQTIPAHAPERIALLRLDTDWYESTRHELKQLYDRVVPGGVIIIDDYGWYSGARKAVDEFFASRSFRPLLQRIDRTGRLLIKPTP